MLTEETCLQISCCVHYDKRCRLDRVLQDATRFYAINPVPGKSIQQAVLSKRMGLRAGLWDAVFMDRRRGELQITWIEFKALKGKLTVEQQGWLEWLRDTPIRMIEVRTLDEFTGILDA